MNCPLPKPTPAAFPAANGNGSNPHFFEGPVSPSRTACFSKLGLIATSAKLIALTQRVSDYFLLANMPRTVSAYQSFF
ncbi:hypothetical protein NOR51B_472 [Luminiphilus syltensis NOR5-1B]|uniref:Uncharacterized protein n=1 Tax=Luminiphilus syltensis NOR5-1B TaxID=565045 RepID=B8KV18_9GAMM|nr:hypothetical protein NOR51B_472 [Luminiphilus syltensis NOR5-1B]